MGKIILEVRIMQRGLRYDVEVSEDITAHELVRGLNAAYDLGIDVNDIGKCFVRVENPTVLLKGDKHLYEYGLHNGSIIVIP